MPCIATASTGDAGSSRNRSFESVLCELQRRNCPAISGNRAGIVDESYERITRKSQQSSDCAQSDWDCLCWLSVASGRRNSLAVPCGSLWIYIFGWSLAGMGAQTEVVWWFNEALRFEGYAQGPLLHPEKTIEHVILRPFSRPDTNMTLAGRNHPPRPRSTLLI
jgi:hypothetical protein